jgi:hypothetical protein
MSNSINHLATADGLFFGKGGLDQRKTAKMVDDAPTTGSCSSSAARARPSSSTTAG